MMCTSSLQLFSDSLTFNTHFLRDFNDGTFSLNLKFILLQLVTLIFMVRMKRKQACPYLRLILISLNHRFFVESPIRCKGEEVDFGGRYINVFITVYFIISFIIKGG